MAILVIFFRLGEILDISEPPQNADAIVVLGGDWEGFRIKKALSLYQKGFAKNIIVNEFSDFDIQTEGKRAKTESEFLILNHVPKENILFLYNAGNTMYELHALKSLAVSKGFHRLIIVSAPPHLRRVKILAENAAEFQKAGVSLIYAGSDPSWWHPDGWYKNKTSRIFVISEVIKITSNYIAYVVLEKHGLLEPARRYFGPFIHDIKNFFQALLRKLDST